MADEPAVDLPRESSRAILFQFVVFPLAVVAVGVAVFLLFGVLASENQSVPEYLSEVQSGSTHARWQAAYQLSKSLKRGEAAKYPDLALKVGSIYRAADDDDPRVRRYLAMVMGTLGDRRSTPVLVEGLQDDDVETRVYALWALAQIGDPRAAPAISKLLASNDRDIRKTAAYALGEIGEPSSKSALKSVLGDQTADVRWNAAIALAKMNDSTGIGVIREMADRSRLAQTPMREDQKESTIIAGMTAWMALAPEEAAPSLTAIAKTDPNLRVRDAATKIVQSYAQPLAASP